jgi:hypothetical protein
VDHSKDKRSESRVPVRHPRAHAISLLQAPDSQEVADEEDLVSEDRNVDDNVDFDAIAAEIKHKGNKVSLMAVMDIIEADKQPLDEEGYSVVASQRSNRKMERFVERVAQDLGLEVVDAGGLKGLVPYYSGQHDTQSFSALQTELLTTAEQSDSWVAVKDEPKEEKDEPREKPETLLQMDAEQKSEQTNTAEPVSLLAHASTAVAKAVSKAHHKVPDLAVAVFGSRTAFILCTMGLILAVFCLDERKRTAKDIDDVLNLSPNPPSAKEDPFVAATLKSLRAGKKLSLGEM